LSSTRTTPWLTQRFAGTYRRFRHLFHEGAKFLIVGLIGVGVTNLVFIPLHGPLGLGPLTSVTIATIVATAVTFLGNRYWSFRHREGAGPAKEGATFFFLNGVGLLIQYAVLGFSNYALGLTTKIENVIAVNLGIGLGTLFRFWSYRKWVWVPAEVHLARLRRGRHRKGRPQAIAAAPVPATLRRGIPDATRADGPSARRAPPPPVGSSARRWPPAG
jgi:putative flippase GtrA